jgi:hypothetical protein
VDEARPDLRLLWKKWLFCNPSSGGTSQALQLYCTVELDTKFAAAKVCGDFGGANSKFVHSQKSRLKGIILIHPSETMRQNMHICIIFSTDPDQMAVYAKVGSRQQHQRILHESYQFLVQLVQEQQGLNEEADQKRMQMSGLSQLISF